MKWRSVRTLWKSHLFLSFLSFSPPFLGGFFIAHIIFVLSVSQIHLPRGFKGDQKLDSQYSVNTPELASWQRKIHCCLGQWVIEISEVRELHIGKRDAIHEASNTEQERYFRESAFLLNIIVVLTCPAPFPVRFYSVLGYFSILSSWMLVLQGRHVSVCVG